MSSALIVIFLFTNYCIGQIVIPIRRVESFAESSIRHGKTFELTAILKTITDTSTKSVGRSTTSNDDNIVQQILVDYFFDSEYIGNLNVGTPAVSYPVLMDTGSSDLWLADVSCRDCFGMNPFYDASASSTSKRLRRSTIIEYGSGAVLIRLVNDTVCLGNACYKSQTFGRAIYVDQSFQYSNFTGLFGLGWPQLSAENAQPLIQNILSQLPQPLFTVWLNSVGLASINGTINYGGSITFGGLDTVHCNSTVNYVNLTALSYWQFAMDSVYIGDYSSSQGWTEVISDTGTSVILGPWEVIEGMATALGATDNGGYYTLPCNGTYPPVILSIGGNNYTIPSNIYLGAEGYGICFFAFIPNESPFDQSWILGDPWIREYCNVYNIGTEQIGFAERI